MDGKPPLHSRHNRQAFFLQHCFLSTKESKHLAMSQGQGTDCHHTQPQEAVALISQTQLLGSCSATTTKLSSAALGRPSLIQQPKDKNTPQGKTFLKFLFSDKCITAQPRYLKVITSSIFRKKSKKPRRNIQTFFNLQPPGSPPTPKIKLCFLFQYFLSSFLF